MTQHAHAEVSDELWQRFHDAVNMTSRELVEWLGVEPDVDPSPNDGPPPLGVGVLEVLRKRRTDLTGADVEVMQKVVDVVAAETDGVPAGEVASDERRRYRLMNVGHDPLRAG